MLDLGDGTTELKFRGEVYKLRLPCADDYDVYNKNLGSAKTDEEKASLLYKFIEDQGLPSDVRKKIPLVYIQDIVDELLGNGKS